jgi:hypothetical protein
LNTSNELTVKTGARGERDLPFQPAAEKLDSLGAIRMNQDLHAALNGAWAGAVATIPMSAVMAAADSAGLMGEHPPKVIVETALERTGFRANEREENSLALAAHLGFGAGAGAIFGLMSRRFRRRTSTFVAGGIAFGLLVYTVSYKGWIPSLGILPEPEDDRPGRPTSMIAAHVVFGSVLGAIIARGAK